jgi:hypothetical protein
MQKSELQVYRSLAVVIGSFYIFGIGFMQIPVAFQLVILILMITGGLFICRVKNGDALHLIDYVLLGGSSIIGVTFGFNTNFYVVIIGIFTVIIGLTLAFLRLTASGNPLQSPGHSFSASMQLIGAVICNFFSEFSFTQFIGEHHSFPRIHVRPISIWGIIYSAPILIIFHLLFASVNEDYSNFVLNIAVSIWNILKIIINIDFIINIFQLFIVSYLTFTIFTTRFECLFGKNSSPSSREWVHLLIGSSICLFALFSSFQSKLLFINTSTIDFKTLSLYTQKGFWELLLAASLGYLVFLFAIWSRPVESNSWKNLLLLFCSGLMLITLFSFHKLALLQFIFGLKDQRILATTAVLLILLTCILAFLRVIKKSDSEHTFRLQIYGLIGAVSFLSIINLDLMITKFWPTSYYIEGKKSKDFGYLLNNSLDNYSEWLTLMDEVEKVGLRYPENYYWGAYKPLCSNHSNRSTHFEWQDSLNYLLTNYDHKSNNGTIRDYLATNYRVRKATELYRDNWNRFNKFFAYMSNNCPEYGYLPFPDYRQP